jgi:hypothetical protein
MRGDRYGEVVKQGQKGTAHVKLDKSGRTKRYREDDLESIASVFDREAAQRGGRNGVGAAGRSPRARAPGRGAQRGGVPHPESAHSGAPVKWHASMGGHRERAFAALTFLLRGKSIRSAMFMARYDASRDEIFTPPPASWRVRVTLEGSDAIAAIRHLPDLGRLFKSDDDVWRALGVPT